MSGMNIDLMTTRLAQAKAILGVVMTQLNEPDGTKDSDRIIANALWGAEDLLDDVSEEINKNPTSVMGN